MNKHLVKHFATACGLLGLLSAAALSLGQRERLGPHTQSRAVNVATNRTGASQEPGDVPGTLSVTSFGTLDFPGSSDSAAYSLNDHGQFVGGFGPDLEVVFANTGFTLTANNSFKKVAYPGALQTGATGINASGEIVGIYVDSSTWHGFQLLKGVYTAIDFPGSSASYVDGISNAGEIIGVYYNTGDTVGHGFYLIGSTYTSLDIPGATYTFPCTANASGEIVGEYIDSAGIYHGFMWVSGTFTTIDYPGAVYSALYGINDNGDVVGEYGDGSGGVNLGFEHGFAYIKGQYLSVDVPFVGSAATWITGINKYCQISGIYIDSATRFYGFTAKIVP